MSFWQKSLNDGKEEEDDLFDDPLLNLDGKDPMNTSIINAIGAVDVAEVYSPVRVTAEARKSGMKAGEATDLTTGWDFRLEKDRKTLKYTWTSISLIFSSADQCAPCFPRCKAYQQAREHIRWVVGLYRKQAREGRVFLHEHPANASSWSLEEVKDLSRKDGVILTQIDQCTYGLRTWGQKRDRVWQQKRRRD